MRDANYEPLEPGGDGEGAEPVLFDGAAGGDDGELITQEEAAAICGCSVDSFLIGVQNGMFPPREGHQDPQTEYVWVGKWPGGRDRWERRPRWRRGAVVAAVDNISRRVAPMFENEKRKDVRR